MSYGGDIVNNLLPQHEWKLDGDVTDNVGSADATNSGFVLTGSPLCKDVTNSAYSNGISDRITIPDTTDINNSAQDRKCITGWFRLSAIQNPPKMVYNEGNDSQSFKIVVGWGNNLLFEVDETTMGVLQIFGDTVLEINREYHFCVIFEGNGYGNEFRAYLDGVKQLNAEPIDRTPDVATLPVRTPVTFGSSSGTVSVGGVAVGLISPINGYFNEWFSFNGAAAVLSDTDVKVELFEKGALGTNIITSGTESAMQTLIDNEANVSGTNVTCDIEVQTVTGDGDLTLTLDNRTFDDLTSIHVKYLGTGTLTLVNTNGANALQSKCSAPWGTIVVENPATLTLNGIVTGSEVRIYDDDGVDSNDFGTELAGVETLSGTSFQYQHPGITNNIVIQIMASNYEEEILRITLNSSDRTISFTQTIDNND